MPEDKLLIDQARDALLVVDMQNDHVSGSLAHPGASTLIYPINSLADLFDRVVVVKDWHPPAHVSFLSAHGLDQGEGTFLEVT